MPYTFFSDPGHGWLAVPIEELDRLGIRDRISRYSHKKDGIAYLEEDCDAAIFIDAKKSEDPRGEFSFTEIDRDEYSPIREYDPF